MRANRRPPTRGPWSYLWWLVTSQGGRVALGALLGSTWMVALTVPPYLLRRAIDDGMASGEFGALVGWAGALLGVGALTAWLAIMRHRTMSRIRMDASFRTAAALTEHSVRLGATLPRRVKAGEVVTLGMSDVLAMSRSLTATGPGVGSVIAYLVIAGLLLAISPPLAAVVLLGVPVLAVVVGPLLGRVQSTGATYRSEQGALTTRMVDIIEGLHVLNGVGGKDQLAEKYRRDSQRLKHSGYHVGAVTSWVQAMAVGLPAIFLGAVTWLAARMAAEGTITIGALVAVCAYAAILVIPVATFIESGIDISAALVAARRVVAFLAIEPDIVDGPHATDRPERAPLIDPTTGVTLAPGQLTAVATAERADALALADRLARFAPSPATWGAIPLAEVALRHLRDRILIADPDAEIFTGSLRDVLAGAGTPNSAAMTAALHAAAAEEIVLGLPDGLDSAIEPHGRNLSGGQRQRIRLARALLANPDVLIAVDPTSAVDVLTEALIAQRLGPARAGTTTMITTTSPALLEVADHVYHLAQGHVVASGTHQSLLAQGAYRDLVARGASADHGPEHTRGHLPETAQG